MVAQEAEDLSGSYKDQKYNFRDMVKPVEVIWGSGKAW